MDRIKFIKLAISLALPFFVGLIGGLVTFPAINTWYASLAKPSFNPPNWIFGPVWSLLYLLMGISFYLVIKGKSTRETKIAAKIFFAQLLVNSLWSYVFFGLKSPLWAFGVIIALWLLIIVMILRFYKINRLASFLNIPYLLWVSFALVLNIFIYILN